MATKSLEPWPSKGKPLPISPSKMLRAKVAPYLSCIELLKRLEPTVHAVKVNNLIMLLTQRMGLMLKSIEQVDSTTSTKNLMYCVDSLFSEIEAWLTKLKSANLLTRYFQSQLNGYKVIIYNSSITRLMEKFQVKCPAREEDFQMAFNKDHVLLSGMVEQILQDPDLTTKAKVEQLGIKSWAIVDTMEVLRVGMAKNNLIPSVRDEISSITKYLTEKSGRKVEERPDFMMISPDDIQYLQDTPIGNGSFGEVFVAWWQGQRVAVKRAIDSIQSEDVIKMIEREAKVWYPLKHPNVIPLYGVCLNTDKPALVMPFMPNGSLIHFLIKHPETTLYQRIKMMCDVSFAMAYLHLAGIAHGDLKPDNILLDENLVCKVTDFGMAGPKVATNSTKRPETGATRFVAPERYKRGNKISESTDVFAFGMTFYQILTSYLPFHEEPNGDVVKDWIKDGERPDRPENLPDNIWKLLEAAWNHDPMLRPTFQEISVSLSIILKSLVDTQKKQKLPETDNELTKAFKFRDFSSSPVEMLSQYEIQSSIAAPAAEPKIKVPERTSSTSLMTDFVKHLKFQKLRAFPKFFPRREDSRGIESFVYPPPPALVSPTKPSTTTKLSIPTKPPAGMTLEDAEDIYSRGCNLFYHGYYIESIQYFHLIHERYPYASHKLGEIYFYGLGVDKDLKVAKSYVSKAARKDDADSNNFLAIIYQSIKEYNKAREYFIRAGELGHAGALNNLGLMYKHGLGCDKDAYEALRLFKKSGLPIAQFNMGVLYYKGDLVKRDYMLALKCFHDAARRGFGEAEMLISEMYRKGRGVPCDLKQAEYHYEQAQRMGNLCS